MNFRVRPVTTKRRTETPSFDQTLIPVEIIGEDFLAKIAGVPKTITIRELCIPFGINHETKNITANGVNVNTKLDACVGEFIGGCIVPKITIEIEDICIPEDEDSKETCVTIDELLEENSLITLENESLKDENAKLREEIEKITRVKDSLFNIIVEASNTMAKSVAELVQNEGEI